jgi:hypothetical protein
MSRGVGVVGKYEKIKKNLKKKRKAREQPSG